MIPLTAANVTTANVQDNQIYVPLTSSLSSVFSLPYLLYMIADPGYDETLYEYSKKIFGIDLICSQQKDMKVIPKIGLSLYTFINLHWNRLSTVREERYIESLIEYIKAV